MNKFAGSVFLVIACCYLSSCSFLRSVTGRKGKSNDSTSTVKIVDTVRAALPPSVTVTDTASKVSLRSAASQQLIDDVTPVFKKRLEYKTFKGKAKMHFEGPDQKQEFTAHFMTQKDSLIWINITALSGVVQVARILITPDSFFMINYQDQEVTKIALQDAAKLLPTKVDFSSLQNFIIGAPLRDGPVTDAVSEVATWSITVEDTAYVQHLVYKKTDSTLVIAQMSTHKPGGPRAETQYNGYMTISDRRISTGRVLNIQKGADTYTLDMNFARIDFDQQLSFPFSIPENYTIK